jgi:hypothetical protein
MASVKGTSRGRSPARRRSTSSGDRPKKVGWQVSQSIAEAVKEAVERGAAESQNAFVEDALLRRLKDLRREKIYAAYEEAAQDPAFMEDMRSTGEVFDVTTSDGLESGD